MLTMAVRKSGQMERTVGELPLMKTSETRRNPAHKGDVPGSSLKQSPLCVISNFHKTTQMCNHELGPSGVLASKTLSSSDVNNLEWLLILKKRLVLFSEVRVYQLIHFWIHSLISFPVAKITATFPWVLPTTMMGLICK